MFSVYNRSSKFIAEQFQKVAQSRKLAVPRIIANVARQLLIKVYLRQLRDFSLNNRMLPLCLLDGRKKSRIEKLNLPIGEG